MIVLGIDAGLAACGTALVRLDAGREELVWLLVFTSRPADRALEIRAGDDLRKRAGELAAFLERLVAEARPDAVALEAPSWPKSIDSAAKLGVAFGVVFALAERHRLPVAMASAVDSKRAVCGAPMASRDEVMRAVEGRFQGVAWPDQVTLWEHAADAVVVVLACLDGEVLRAARRAGDERPTCGPGDTR